MTCLECLLSTHLDKLFVLTSLVSFLVQLRWPNTVSVGSTEPSVLLVTIYISTVVMLNSGKVGLTAMFLKMSQALLVLELDEELDVRGTSGPLL